MAQVINTNSLSLITQNNINKNQSALATSIERLSSGLRINSAKDDAAGQAIANRFTSNIKGLTQAARNANDGISLAQTTEGALSEINNNLQRVRELTVQASTGTNSDSDLSSIQDEIKSRLDEIDRVSGQTQFNGVNVLSDNREMKIQVGANDGETISINLQTIDAKSLKLDNFTVSGQKDFSEAKLTDTKGNVVTASNITDGAETNPKTIDLQSYKDTDGNTLYAVKGDDGKYYKATVEMTDADGTDPAKAKVTVTTDEVTGTATADPLKVLDAAIASVDKFRSSLGAVQNQLTSAVTNLNNTTTNLSEAQSRIQDADYATEVSNMSKAQIIQQAGNSVLSKANQVPQQILSLLQG
ncbi:FliC/FljB family flagellin [Pluralibacter gergoviae]|uniref:Flagellin n=1 Tax=Pluralibacter gergoviae TaxID=61647 RepID=A0AAW8HMU7_PLUGE|nr:FliC/FljB family flagellin [Pluralibacter gergoviae]AVR04778.1 flagellin FliC [Pluralibacter gergoviae]EKW9966184.1 FliC/FljB family flagellin [Pluralibacter gergoviae]KMK05997.1 flagellin [Pluralibacter gergoviae]KMK28968.1 flagellin [Pluralibacter gergoviae]MDQ2309542.1 FliC/FljB family flagellin [Pluralibacter gergoviae]